MSKEFMNEATLKRLIEKIKSEFSKYLKRDGISVTAEQGDNVSVTQSKTAKGIELKFTIPKGEPGAQGEPGLKGDVGPEGPPGIQGEKGDKGDTGPQGEKGEVGPEGPQGESGSNGISATHSWNGTILTVTSASGTSSADLKGEKGDKGVPGEPGINGYTPIRGTDYWTEADKAEIKGYVDEAILGGAW